jgi:hypothetical protein
VKRQTPRAGPPWGAKGGRCRIDTPGSPRVETVALNSPGQDTLRGEKKLTLARAQGREFTVAQTTTAVRLCWGVENQREMRLFFAFFSLVRS